MTETTNRIVVGVDGSPGSEEALRWALRVAAATAMDVEAILVWSDNWAIAGPPSLFGAGRTGRRRLRAALADAVRSAVREEPGTDTVGVLQRVLPGHAAEVLVAESEGADMLVVGSTGAGGIRRWMLGSVSQHCAHHAHVPVVIVPTSGHRMRPGLTEDGEAPVGEDGREDRAGDGGEVRAGQASGATFPPQVTGAGRPPAEPAAAVR